MSKLLKTKKSFSKKKDSEDMSWILEGIVGFLRSPTWTVPVMNFIEEHCACFENKEENRLEHTDMHLKYKAVVENLLGEYLKELSISIDEFSQACNKGNAGFERLEGMFEYIWAADDFLLFKRIMINHNLELEMQAVSFSQGKKDADFYGDFPPFNPKFQENKKGDFFSDDSSKDSSTSKERMHNIMSQSKSEYLTILQQVQELEEQEESDLQRAIHFSQQEMERLEAQAEDERKMLEEAIRLSLEASNQEKDEHVNFGNGISNHTHVSSTLPLPETPTATAILSTSSANHKTSSKSKKKDQKVKSSESASQPHSLPPLQKANQSSADAALDWIASAQKDSSSTQSQPGLGSSKKVFPGDVASSPPGVDPEEMAKRKAYLQGQREKLMEIKKKKRDEELAQFQKGGASQHTVKVGESVQLSEASTSDAEEKEKLLQARRALADRLKREVIKNGS